MASLATMHARPGLRAPQATARTASTRRVLVVAQSQVTRRERIAAAGLAAFGALQLTLSGPSLAFVGSTPNDLRENTARASPNIELGKDAAKAVDRNKPALPSPGQIQGKVKDASRKLKSEAQFDLALGELKPLKESAKKPGLFDVIKQKALTKESPSVQLNKKGGTPTPAPASKSK